MVGGDPQKPAGPHPGRDHVLLWLLLILLGGLLLRTHGLSADVPHYVLPDEGTLHRMVGQMADGPNPKNFHWPGSLQVYVTSLTFGTYLLLKGLLFGGGTLESLKSGFWQDPSDFFVVARLLVILSALATLWLVFRICRPFGPAAALLAALFVAVSPLHVEYSARAKVDIPAAFFLAAVLALAARLVRDPSPRRFLLCGFVGGLGCSVKYSNLLTVVAIAAAAWTSGLMARSAVRSMALALVAIVAGFVVGCPYSVLDFPAFARDVVAQSQHQATGHIGREPEYWPVAWYLVTKLMPAVGAPLLVLGVLGAALGFSRSSRELHPVIAVTAVFALLVTSSRVSFDRYALPHVVTLSILGATAVTHPRWPKALTIVLAVVATAIPLRESVRLAVERARPDVRAAASDWLHGHVETGARIFSTEGGPVIPSAQILPFRSAVSDDLRESVQRGDFDYLIITGRELERVASPTALKNHPDIVGSQRALYSWIRNHRKLLVRFDPNERYRGWFVEIYDGGG